MILQLYPTALDHRAMFCINTQKETPPTDARAQSAYTALSIVDYSL